jgi:hypothetical protein
MDFIQTMLKDIEHCSLSTVTGVTGEKVYAIVYEVVYILYTALRSLRTLYYREVLSKFWLGVAEE